MARRLGLAPGGAARTISGIMADVVLSNVEGRVGVATLNRPEVMNALSVELMDRLIEVLQGWDRDEGISVMVIAGGERAFAAGADIGEMAQASVVDMDTRNNLARWLRIKAIRKPLIAAVSGYALGGGCELAMHCDMIVASESAVFGQPEINLGVMPGAGGTQRLTRAIGKFRAMEVILAGKFLSAHEAMQAGLVTKVVVKEQCLAEALRLAHEVATKPLFALKYAKEAVLKADELSLSEGLEYERKLFYALFATGDQKEGMRAFLEKRKPKFTGR
jgi:enoyl-CoA hydratase